MVRLFFSVGRRDKVRPGDLVGAIAGETNIPGNSIGNIDIFDKYSFVEVPAEMAETVLQVMDNNMIRRKKVNVEIAKMEPAV
jgi:ATP-dependent RNA helicase DeaD